MTSPKSILPPRPTEGRAGDQCRPEGRHFEALDPGSPLRSVRGDKEENRVDNAKENGRPIVEHRARPRYSLDELLAQCDTTGDNPPECRDWLDAGPVGKEQL